MAKYGLHVIEDAPTGSGTPATGGYTEVSDASPLPVTAAAGSGPNLINTTGAPMDNETFSNRALLMALWKELRAIRQILGTAYGIPVPSDQDDVPTTL